MGKVRLKKGDCVYCHGKGYYQLLLGGTETCTNCEGKGRSNTVLKAKTKQYYLDLIHIKLS